MTAETQNENEEQARGCEASELSGLVMCECSNWARTGPDDGGEHHHKRCPKYSTDKHPRLFYYEEGCDAWMPWVEGHPFYDMMIEHGDTTDLSFKRLDMTDKEFDGIPEAE